MKHISNKKANICRRAVMETARKLHEKKHIPMRQAMKTSWKDAKKHYWD